MLRCLSISNTLKCILFRNKSGKSTPFITSFCLLSVFSPKKGMRTKKWSTFCSCYKRFLRLTKAQHAMHCGRQPGQNSIRFLEPKFSPTSVTLCTLSRHTVQYVIQCSEVFFFEGVRDRKWCVVFGWHFFRLAE